MTKREFQAAEKSETKAKATYFILVIGSLFGFLFAGGWLIVSTGMVSSAAPVVTGVLLMSWHLFIGINQLFKEAAERNLRKSSPVDRSTENGIRVAHQEFRDLERRYEQLKTELSLATRNRAEENARQRGRATDETPARK